MSSDSGVRKELGGSTASTSSHGRWCMETQNYIQLMGMTKKISHPKLSKFTLNVIEYHSIPVKAGRIRLRKTYNYGYIIKIILQQFTLINYGHSHST